MPVPEARSRDIVCQTVDEIALPSEDWRRSAAEGRATQARHDALAREAMCLNTVRVAQPPHVDERSPAIRVAAWNVERCKRVEDSAALLREAAADICLLTEMDLGMARSANRDTTAELGEILGMGHVFGVEFIELGCGNARETAEFRDIPNRAGLHGNGIVSRFPIDRAAILPLDGGGHWFANAPNPTERRIGRRMAVAVRHLLPNPVWFIAVHYESSLGPDDRAEETCRLVQHVHKICGTEPVLIGGDFNCKGIVEAGMTGRDILARPQEAEPMFGLFADAGFEWRTCNIAADTTRLHPWDEPTKPTKKIDWFFARGLPCGDPSVQPAVSSEGQNLSDHEPIFVTVRA